MISRREFCRTASAGVALSVAGCGGCGTQTSGTSASKVRVGYLPMVSSLTYFVAVERGYFVDEKLELEANPVNTSDLLSQQLLAGHIDLAVELAIVPLLQSLSGSKPRFGLFSVSKIVDGSAFDGILVKKNSGLKTLESLSQKKIASFPGTTSPASIAAVFGAKCPGKPLPTFELNVKPADQLNALGRGEVDAIHAYEPILTIGKKKFGYVEAFGSVYAAQLSPNPIGVAAVNREFEEKNPDVCRRAISALDKAVKFIEDKPQDARAILAKYTKADPEICREMQIMPMSVSNEDHDAILDHYLTILEVNENPWSWAIT